MERRDSQKIFVIKDVQGKTWTTKRGLEILLGVCAAATNAIWELSKKTDKTVEEVLHEIAFTIKVFEEEFEEEKNVGTTKILN